MVKSICLLLRKRFQVDFTLNSLNSYVFLVTLFKRRMTIEKSHGVGGVRAVGVGGALMLYELLRLLVWLVLRC